MRYHTHAGRPRCLWLPNYGTAFYFITTADAQKERPMTPCVCNLKTSLLITHPLSLNSRSHAYNSELYINTGNSPTICVWKTGTCQLKGQNRSSWRTSFFLLFESSYSINYHTTCEFNFYTYQGILKLVILLINTIFLTILEILVRYKYWLGPIYKICLQTPKNSKVGLQKSK